MPDMPGGPQTKFLYKNCPVRYLALRKWLAVIVTLVWIFVVAACLKTGNDIPGNVFNLLVAMCGTVYAGYFGSSAWETGKKLQSEMKNGFNGGDGQ